MRGPLRSPGRSRSRPYVTSGGFRALTAVLWVVGAAAAVAGPAFAVNGATQAPAFVSVNAGVAPDRVGPEGVLELPADVVGIDALPDRVMLLAEPDVTVRAWGSTVAEQLLARGDIALLGLVVGAGALLLVPLLRSVAAGRPFEPGSARRLALLASVVAVHGVIGPLLPAAATAMVLARTGLGEPGVLEPGVVFPFAPFALAAGLLVAAEAFRRGEQIADDVEGLV